MTFTNSVGGLLISIVMKYADNIMKAYAQVCYLFISIINPSFQSVAIIGAALGSWLLFDFVPNFLFLLGMAFVIASICMYTMFPNKQPVQRKSEFVPWRLMFNGCFRVLGRGQIACFIGNKLCY
jgi:UDP-sugar transporter A1/2/3